MKKFSLILGLSLTFILAFAFCAMADNALTVGADFGGKLNPTGDNYTVNTGYSVGYEFTIPQGRMEYGGGVEYQLYRTVQGNSNPTIPDGSQFNFIPLYGVMRYNFSNNNSSQPYAVARFGYNLVNGDSGFNTTIGTPNGGLYYAVGAGMNFNKKIKAEVMYSSSQGSGNSYNLLNNAYALRVGYKF